MEVVNVALGSSIRPVYVVFKRLVSLVGNEFRAEVKIIPCPRGTNQPYVIQGGGMPTIELAIQVAAWESLVRLWHSETVLASDRDFYFFPTRPRPGVEIIQTPL